MTDLSFGQALRVVRRRQGLTQAQLAARVGLARQTVVGIEAAAGNPPPRTYHRLLNALGFTSGLDLMESARGHVALSASVPPPAAGGAGSGNRRPLALPIASRKSDRRTA